MVGSALADTRPLVSSSTPCKRTSSTKGAPSAARAEDKLCVIEEKSTTKAQSVSAAESARLTLVVKSETEREFFIPFAG